MLTSDPCTPGAGASPVHPEIAKPLQPPRRGSDTPRSPSGALRLASRSIKGKATNSQDPSIRRSNLGSSSEAPPHPNRVT